MSNTPKYKTAAEMQAKIDEYFLSCEGVPATTSDGTPIFNKYGTPCYVKPPRPPTVTGLALFLGFKSRQAIINYKGRSAAFNDTLTRARSRIEEYAEMRLYDRDGERGAEFNLRVNFGWRTEADSDENTPEPTRIIDDV